ncbi:hypothetical protein CGMCC3_g4684 [Colletotrichum fructicola]|nr:uncharacterized protein CGMCC3_g4684 [Colletotrichum fructicola]KAE9579077.1 hypothetical protein CGMCC3_g4684 [Colletotrichum fructicola]
MHSQPSNQDADRLGRVPFAVGSGKPHHQLPAPYDYQIKILR